MKRESIATAKRSRRARRRYSVAFKREVVEKTLAPGASVAAIALEHRLNTNLLFKWRRDQLRELARRVPSPTMLPVMVETSSMHVDSPRQRVTAGVIEIELAAGRVRLKGAVDVESLRAVIDLLRQ
jgi:transposase